MLRDNAPTGAVRYEWNGRIVHLPGAANAPRGTRLKFPQTSADLSVRWCSSTAKIDVADRVLRNDPMFANARTLFITGERAEESPNRARYADFERHRADRRDGKAKRLVDHWRPVLRWPEQAVWDILRRHGVNPHPAYHAGFGRLSCRTCIFASDAQWATLALHDPAGAAAIAAYESRFDRAICRSQRSVLERAARAQPFASATPNRMKHALANHYDDRIHIAPDDWQVPAGAFAGHTGPS